MRTMARAGRWWIIAAVFANAATCMGTDAGAGARPSTLAVVGIVSGGGKPIDPNLAGEFISLLEVELSGQGNLKLLERQRRDALLKEQQLSLTALADAQAPLRLGRLLGAELTVWGE